MKGQKLFVRPMEPADLPAVEAFLAREAPEAAVPQAALLGKLVGDLVSVLALELTAEAVLIHDLVVASDLRKKQIGRYMVEESYALAAKFDRHWLVFDAPAPGEFLRRVGFAEHDARMVRRVVGR